MVCIRIHGCSCLVLLKIAIVLGRYTHWMYLKISGTGSILVF
uniref:Uncharacterized protein n=1 Tax=Rhizophora mucronata TaxID=61149 RepID=A0A2P2IV25_RHIMU